MTNDPDLVLKSHGSVARDPSSWLRVGPGCRENRGAVLGLGSPPHCNRTHSCAASEPHTLCLTSKLCLKIPSPAASLSLFSLQNLRRERTCSQPRVREIPAWTSSEPLFSVGLHRTQGLSELSDAFPWSVGRCWVPYHTHPSLC